MMPPRMLFCSLAALVVLSGTTIPFAAEQDEPFSPATLREIGRVEAEIDRIEAESLNCSAPGEPGAANRAAWKTFAV